MTIRIASVAILLSLMTSCREKEGHNRCQCIDNNGALVIDTTTYEQYDQAYQICEGKEGTNDIWKCECSKLD